MSSKKGRVSALQTALLLIFLLPFAFFGQHMSAKAAPANQGEGPPLCKPLPSDIQRHLRAELGSWKIEESKDLSTTARERWESEKPQECPGIAVGPFAGGTTLSYAVLLVPREHPGAGYRFLVFSPSPGKSSYEMTVVEQSDHGGAANFFIRLVRISKFFDEPSRRKFGVRASEGILLADAGAKEYETDVYFWANGSYQHQPVDY